MKLIILFLLITYVNSIDVRVDPIVVTGQGIIRGIKASDGSYSSFVGVPYATVDLEDPFGPPKKHSGFGVHVYNAYDGSIKCPQSTPQSMRALKNEGESLDCLTLNIYSPILAGTQNPMPVLVWIHGGDFKVGSAGEYNPENLVRKGIVVVTLNYRLGPYGFLCLDVPALPGNQGLKDQYEALVWVRDNIRAFGGNPYNVTLAGQGAGSSSALLHLYSENEKLYHKLIIESGTPQNIGLFAKSDVEAAQKLASNLGRNTTNTEEALDFLKSVNPNQVVKAAEELNLELKPCHEKSFSSVKNIVADEPYNLSNERKVKNTPILIGHTSKERLSSISIYGDNYFKTDPFYDKIKDNYNLDGDELTEAVKIVRHFYIGDEPISKSITSELETFDSDISVNHPIQRIITSLIKENANPIYEYEFRYIGDTQAEGAATSEELKYLFKLADLNVDNTDNSNLVANRLLTMWANFIKYGNPTPETNDLLPVEWTTVTREKRPYIAIDLDMTMRNRINHDRMAFWDLFHNMYGKYYKYSRNC